MREKTRDKIRNLLNDFNQGRMPIDEAERKLMDLMNLAKEIGGAEALLNRAYGDLRKEDF